MTTRFGLGGLVWAAMVVGALLLGSCSTSSQPTPATSTSSTKSSGTLKISVLFHKGGPIDPQNLSVNTFQVIGAAIFDSLTELTPDAQIRPGIAEKWEISADGKAHTFYIRKGVKFHDGSDLTGADVKFSVERMLAPESVHQDSAGWRAQIAKVELKDDYTVVLNLKQPQFELLDGFETLAGTPAVLPKKYYEQKGADYVATHPVGSGPWKVLSYVEATSMELEAVENHWRGAPKYKSITLLSVQEEASKVAMLKTGELDIADVAPDSAPGLKAAGLRIVPHDGAAQFFDYLFYDLEHPDKYALGDVRVRKALSLAINRKELADKIYGGYAEPSALLYAPKTAYFFDSNLLKPDPFDAEGAKKLLGEAGFAGGFSMKLWNSDTSGPVSQVNQATAGYWRKVGVNVELVPIEFANALKMWGPKQVPEVWNSAWGWASGGGVFQFERMQRMYHSKRSSAKNINMPRLDELIEKVPLTRDPAEKKKLALEAAVMAKNEYSLMSVLDLKTVFAVGPKVGTFTPIKGMTGFAGAFETISHSR